MEAVETKLKNPKGEIWKNRILVSFLITIASEALFVYVKYGELLRSYDFTLGLELFFTFFYFLSLFWIYPKISRVFHSPLFGNLKSLYVNLIEGTVVVVGTTLLTIVMKLLPLWIIIIMINARTEKVNLAFDWNSVRQNIILHAILALFIYYFVERERIKKNLVAQHLNNARIQEEYMEWQLRTLKNQVNPKFLFKSLDALDDLMYQDEERSVELVSRLSTLYRMLLDHKEQLVPLQTELDLVKAYDELLQVRPGKEISFEYDIVESYGNYQLPPGSLYKLTECFVDSAKGGTQVPPKIKISTGSDFINISGPAPYPEKVSLLVNHLTETYRVFTERKIKVEQRENGLLVQLPLLPVSK
ncbi:histidine kinase [Salinimicrobium sp. HB62]|uniref:histidine kinase n=1 Tax=Salinimicrobium sp. HB62 TaxID=3077781 RepID=UPI002D7854D7|nr:histidine kinase [Salinimicrobium sp. HB62]